MLFFLTCIAGYGQSVTHTIFCDIKNVAEIRFKPGALQVTEYDFTTADQLEKNIANNNGANIQVACNSDWKVNVKAGSANFNYTGTLDDPNMPSTVLKIRNRPDQRIPLKDEDQQIASGTAGGFTDNEIQLRYIAVPKFEYPAGTYDIDVIYTVSRN